jgi:TRAP-type C4-dicarboxylate transport system permease small subunit
MYGIFVLMGILLVVVDQSKTFFLPSLWTLEMAQFAMVAYYMLGGPYSIQLWVRTCAWILLLRRVVPAFAKRRLV